MKKIIASGLIFLILNVLNINVIAEKKYGYAILFDNSQNSEESVRILDIATFFEIINLYDIEKNETISKNTDTLNDGKVVCLIDGNGNKTSVFFGSNGNIYPARLNLTYFENDIYDDAFEFLYDFIYFHKENIGQKLWNEAKPLKDENNRLIVELDGIIFFEDVRPLEYPYGQISTGQKYYEKGVLSFDLGVNGSNPTTFLTRKMFCQMVFNFINRTDKAMFPVEGNRFVDSNDNRVNALFDVGIVKGYGNGQFKPNEYITREETAVIINRVFDFMGYKRNEVQMEIQLKDANDISSWAKDDVYELYREGIFKGISENQFAPKRLLGKYDGWRVLVRMFSE